jgi:hypothetical protein
VNNFQKELARITQNSPVPQLQWSEWRARNIFAAPASFLGQQRERHVLLSGHEHKYGDVRGNGFWAEARRERRAYPAVDL